MRNLEEKQSGDKSNNGKKVEPPSIPSPEELQKEFTELLSKKFGGQVQVVAMGPDGPLIPALEAEEGPQADGAAGEGLDKDPVKEFTYKPREIKAHLDRFVIGQEDAKKALAIAICDHFNHLRAGDTSRHYLKQNVLLLGPTGVGKTYLVQLISELIGVPFVKADATRFSEVGYMGANVDDIIRDLVQKAGGNLKLAEQGIVYVDEVDKLASHPSDRGRDVSGRGVQFGFLRLLENSDVDLNASHDVASQFKTLMSLQRKGKALKEVVNTKNILFVFSGAFHGLEKIINSRLHSKAIGIHGKNVKPTTQDLLRQVGAEDLVTFGFEHEFVGRLPVRVALHELSAEKLYTILTTSEQSVIQQYKDSFQHYDIKLTFTDEALRELAERAYQQKTGARALTSVIEEVLRPFKFELPSTKVRFLEVNGDLLRNPSGFLHHLIN